MNKDSDKKLKNLKEIEIKIQKIEEEKQKLIEQLTQTEILCKEKSKQAKIFKTHSDESATIKSAQYASELLVLNTKISKLESESFDLKNTIDQLVIDNENLKIQITTPVNQSTLFNQFNDISNNNENTMYENKNYIEIPSKSI